MYKAGLRGLYQPTFPERVCQHLLNQHFTCSISSKNPQMSPRKQVHIVLPLCYRRQTGTQRRQNQTQVQVSQFEPSRSLGVFHQSPRLSLLSIQLSLSQSQISNALACELHLNKAVKKCFFQCLLLSNKTVKLQSTKHSKAPSIDDENCFFPLPSCSILQQFHFSEGFLIKLKTKKKVTRLWMTEILLSGQSSTKRHSETRLQKLISTSIHLFIHTSSPMIMGLGYN